MNQSAQSKFDRVRELLRGRQVLVAFSGGVDSATLALLCKESARRTVLLTVLSITFPEREVQLAKQVAAELELPLELIEVDELSNESLAKNPVDRCYYCKVELSRVWLETAQRLGLDTVVEGTNASDMIGHRPGAAAIDEAGVLSPFKVAGITKEEIRQFARERGLSVADRPSMACLASRFPYGTRITRERVKMVDSLEQAVRDLFGVETVRVRFHNDVARIEVGREERARLFDIAKLDRLTEEAKAIGFRYVAIDTQGYRTGSMDEVLGE
ncbi:MAG: ATP-dependent sacrificial sulfur transferase LarE [Candidatus Thorarchaeota archaeon]|nr:ATP-dependent sacrificial sulfur transferase LarE [Candidatus Thorarchaeota archaeon]